MYWIQETGGNHNLSGYKSFYCDYETDIDDLPTYSKEGKVQGDDTVSCQPCAYGSEAFCIETGGVYILSKDTDSWMEMTTSSSGNVPTQDLSKYQQKTDSALETTNKTIVGAINEVKREAYFENKTVLENLKTDTNGNLLYGNKTIADSNTIKEADASDIDDIFK